MRNRRNAALAGVLAAGVLLTQQACAPTEDEAAAPAASLSPAPRTSPSSVAPASTTSESPVPDGSQDAGSGSADAILAGKRQVVIKPVQASESILAVDDKGRLNATDNDSEHSLFVLTRNGDEYTIKSAKANKSGEPDCLGIKSSGSNPLQVVATACDAGRAGQHFKITKEEKKDKSGRDTYAISSQGAFLQISSDYGLIAEELGDSPLRTTYAFVDNGKSTLPALD